MDEKTTLTQHKGDCLRYWLIFKLISFFKVIFFKRSDTIIRISWFLETLVSMDKVQVLQEYNDHLT